MSQSLAVLLLLALLVLLLALMAAQLRRPTGWFGRRVMAALLNEGNKALLDAALDTAAPRAGSRVLDVGFGGGYTLERVAPVVAPERVAGVELSEAMIAAVRDRCGDAFDLRLADAAALPFPDASFDVVLSVSTIYFWPDPTRVLKPGGRVVQGYRSGLVFRMTPLTWFGFRLHGDRRIGRLLEEAGLAAAIRAPRSDEKIAVGTRPRIGEPQA